MKKNIIISIAALLVCVLPLYGANFFVDVNNGNDENTGSSKDQAWKTITFALLSVVENEADPVVLNLAEGIYSPDSGETFPLRMKNYTSLIGSGKDLTIIDAMETGGVITLKYNLGVSIKNLTISNGLISGGDGAGVYCLGSAPILENLIITGNSANRGSGLFLIFTASPLLKNCSIIKNTATDSGGGIFCRDDSSPNLINCDISENTASPYRQGGAVYAYESSPEFTNCHFEKNTSGTGGCFYLSYSSPKIFNCIILENESLRSGGGAFACFDSSPNIISSNIIDNKGKNEGGCITAYGGSAPLIVNSILWNNGQNPIAGEAILNITFSDIEEGYLGTGNISLDPLFIQGPRGIYYLSHTATGQTSNSPCINIGRGFAQDSGLDNYSTRSDGVLDLDRIDIGYHYLPNLDFELGIHPPILIFQSGDTLRLSLTLGLVPANTTADLYFALINPNGDIYSFPEWKLGLKPVASNIIIPKSMFLDNATLIEISLPSLNPMIDSNGNYIFAVVATLPGTYEPNSNIAMSLMPFAK
jgi:parallel beta-helix repeat protein